MIHTPTTHTHTRIRSTGVNHEMMRKITWWQQQQQAIASAKLFFFVFVFLMYCVAEGMGS